MAIFLTQPRLHDKLLLLLGAPGLVLQVTCAASRRHASRRHPCVRSCTAHIPRHWPQAYPSSRDCSRYRQTLPAPSLLLLSHSRRRHLRWTHPPRPLSWRQLSTCARMPRVWQHKQRHLSHRHSKWCCRPKPWSARHGVRRGTQGARGTAWYAPPQRKKQTKQTKQTKQPGTCCDTKATILRPAQACVPWLLLPPSSRLLPQAALATTY